MRASSMLCVLAGVMLSPALVTAQTPGIYRLTICASPCVEADTGVVRGRLVLFANNIGLDTIPAAARADLTGGARWLLMHSAVVNACFTLPTGPTRINGRELYAGIIRRGFTRWERNDSTVRVLLYLSPDAHYTLDGRFEGDRFVGRGDQAICCAYPEPPPASFFLAQRTGDPDVNACMT